MAEIIFYILVFIFVGSFICAAFDWFYNKNPNIEDNLSAVLTLMASLIILITVSTVTSGLESSNVFGSINNALSESIPFYNWIASASEGKGIWDKLGVDISKGFINLVNSSRFTDEIKVFLEELKKTMFMAAVIPLINKFFPTNVSWRYNLLQGFVIKLSANIIIVAISLILYQWFQKSILATFFTNIVMVCFSATPFLSVMNFLFNKTGYNLSVLMIFTILFGKALVVTILYVILVNELMINHSNIVNGINMVTLCIPAVGTIFIMIFGIMFCVKSVIK